MASDPNYDYLQFETAPANPGVFSASPDFFNLQLWMNDLSMDSPTLCGSSVDPNYDYLRFETLPDPTNPTGVFSASPDFFNLQLWMNDLSMDAPTLCDSGPEPEPESEPAPEPTPIPGDPKGTYLTLNIDADGTYTWDAPNAQHDIILTTVQGIDYGSNATSTIPCGCGCAEASFWYIPGMYWPDVVTPAPDYIVWHQETGMTCHPTNYIVGDDVHDCSDFGSSSRPCGGGTPFQDFSGLTLPNPKITHLPRVGWTTHTFPGTEIALGKYSPDTAGDDNTNYDGVDDDGYPQYKVQIGWVENGVKMRYPPVFAENYTYLRLKESVNVETFNSSLDFEHLISWAHNTGHAEAPPLCGVSNGYEYLRLTESVSWETFKNQEHDLTNLISWIHGGSHVPSVCAEDPNYTYLRFETAPANTLVFSASPDFFNLQLWMNELSMDAPTLCGSSVDPNYDYLRFETAPANTLVFSASPDFFNLQLWMNELSIDAPPVCPGVVTIKAMTALGGEGMVMSTYDIIPSASPPHWLPDSTTDIYANDGFIDDNYAIDYMDLSSNNQSTMFYGRSSNTMMLNNGDIDISNSNPTGILMKINSAQWEGVGTSLNKNSIVVPKGSGDAYQGTNTTEVIITFKAIPGGISEPTNHALRATLTAGPYRIDVSNGVRNPALINHFNAQVQSAAVAATAVGEGFSDWWTSNTSLTLEWGEESPSTSTSTFRFVFVNPDEKSNIVVAGTFCGPQAGGYPQFLSSTWTTSVPAGQTSSLISYTSTPSYIVLPSGGGPSSAGQVNNILNDNLQYLLYGSSTTPSGVDALTADFTSTPPTNAAWPITFTSNLIGWRFTFTCDAFSLADTGYDVQNDLGGMVGEIVNFSPWPRSYIVNSTIGDTFMLHTAFNIAGDDGTYASSQTWVDEAPSAPSYATEVLLPLGDLNVEAEADPSNKICYFGCRNAPPFSTYRRGMTQYSYISRHPEGTGRNYYNQKNEWSLAPAGQNPFQTPLDYPTDDVLPPTDLSSGDAITIPGLEIADGSTPPQRFKSVFFETTIIPKHDGQFNFKFTLDNSGANSNTFFSNVTCNWFELNVQDLSYSTWADLPGYPFPIPNTYTTHSGYSTSAATDPTGGIQAVSFDSTATAAAAPFFLPSQAGSFDSSWNPFYMSPGGYDSQINLSAYGDWHSNRWSWFDRNNDTYYNDSPHPAPQISGSASGLFNDSGGGHYDICGNTTALSKGKYYAFFVYYSSEIRASSDTDKSTQPGPSLTCKFWMDGDAVDSGVPDYFYLPPEV